MTRLEMLIDFRAEVSTPSMELTERESLLHELANLQFAPGIVINNVESRLTHSYHDPENSGAIAITGAHVYREAYRLAREAMILIGHHNYNGIFKIKYSTYWGDEEIGGTKNLSIDIQKEFPGFKALTDGNLFPGIYRGVKGYYSINNFIYCGQIGLLPSHQEIIKFIQINFGRTPNRIIDYSREISIIDLDTNIVFTPIPSVLGTNTTIARVASVYQNDRENALSLNNVMAKIAKHPFDRATGDSLRGVRDYTTLTEQVCLVGEPK